MVVRNQRGQGLVEYLIIVALVAVAAMGVMRVVGQNTSAQFANISYALRGEKKQARKAQISESQMKTKDLGDFMSGAAKDDE